MRSYQGFLWSISIQKERQAQETRTRVVRTKNVASSISLWNQCRETFSTSQWIQKCTRWFLQQIRLTFKPHSQFHVTINGTIPLILHIHPYWHQYWSSTNFSLSPWWPRPFRRPLRRLLILIAKKKRMFKSWTLSNTSYSFLLPGFIWTSTDLNMPNFTKSYNYPIRPNTHIHTCPVSSHSILGLPNLGFHYGQLSIPT